MGIMEDIASGVAFIHQKGEVHRDIKPANGTYPYFCSLTLVLYSHRSFVWKIGDFGLTVEGTSGRPQTTENSMGTNGYRAPELVRGMKKVFTNKVDIWAIGCIFYEMVFRRRAFYEDYATLNYSFDGTLYVPPMNSDNIWEIISRDVLVAALEKLLNIDPKQRPTAIEIRQQFQHSSGSYTDLLFASDEANTAC